MSDKCWYYHENSDSLFVAESDAEFGIETDFVWEIGPAVKETDQELLEVARQHSPAIYESAVMETCQVGWKDVFEQEKKESYFKDIGRYLSKEEEKGHIIYPEKGKVFYAFKLTPFRKVKVIILGQDPYIRAGQAMGLAFSAPRGVAPLPPSLVNVFKELCDDMDYPSHGLDQVVGDLTGWARQGVLLLNSCLTVRAGESGSHSGIGWERFTDRVIQRLSEERDGLVFMLWGGYAKGKEKLIDQEKHLVLTAAHPSPMSARNGFFGCKHFSQCNTYLKSVGKMEVDWSKKS